MNLSLLWLSFIVMGVSIVAAPDVSTNVHQQHLPPLTLSTPDLSLVPSDNRLVKLKVDGLVCSFCAYGAEKKLSDLTFIDTDSFGGNGVFVDLKQGFITIALDPLTRVNFGDIGTSITKGGVCYS